MSNRRIYETIGLRYDDADKMEPIVRAVEQMLRAHPEIDTSRILMVNFNAFAPSSLDFFVYTFTKTTDWAHYHEGQAGRAAENPGDYRIPRRTIRLPHLHDSCT